MELGSIPDEACADVGLYEIFKDPNSAQSPSWWPEHSSLPSSPKTPLADLKVVDLTRVIAGPTITRSIAELGASVMRVVSPHVTDLSPVRQDLNWGKWNTHLHLKDEAGAEKLRELIREADVVVDGYRPGVMDRLGFGRQAVFDLVKDRPRGIIHLRENCYGWYGPWAHRSGWQQISDALMIITKSIMEASAPLSHDDYTIAWICAMPMEMSVASLMLDAVHLSLPKPPMDGNKYILGNIGDHNLVITCSPRGAYYGQSPKLLAMGLLSSFRSIQLSLMVGGGGGVPSSNADIRLGDIVVSNLEDKSGGVIQISDKAFSAGQFQQEGMFKRRPNLVLVEVLSKLRRNHRLGVSRMVEFISSAQDKLPLDRAAELARSKQQDYLFQADYDHIEPSSFTPRARETRSDSGERKYLYIDDKQSIYTPRTSISPLKPQSSLSALVDDLFNNVRLGQHAHQPPETIQSTFSRLLKAFALRLGAFCPTQTHRDIMVFIYQRSDEIARSLTMKYLQVYHKDPQPDDTKIKSWDHMEPWNWSLDDIVGVVKNPEKSTVTSTVRENTSAADDDRTPPELAAGKLISGSLVYQWLLGNIRRKIYLHLAVSNLQEAIHERFLILCRRLMEQGFDRSEDRLIGKIITITGSSQDAQAMTSLEYFHQTWHSSRANILQLVEAVANEPAYEHRCTLKDNTELLAWVKGGNLVVEVTRIDDAVVEIGEQLAWLGSALRSSPHDTKIAYCTPFVSSTHIENTPTQTAEAPNSPRISCSIDFKFDDGGQTRPLSSTGQCWHHLFRNPTVVTGFSIPYRCRQGTGLEIPLNILAGLIRAKHVNFFGDKLFIKEFSTLLVPTAYLRDQDQIIWHLLYNVDGNRILYLEGIEAHVGHITLADLETSGHFLGWFSDARCYAGAPDANYLINRSWFRRPSPRGRLNNTLISACREITGGDTFTYGNKDQPYRVIRDEYIEKLSWVSKQFVVMWDAGEKRGWLLNLTDIKGPRRAFTLSSAMEVLLNPDNLSLELYETRKDETAEATIPPVRIRDRINRLYSMLEKIMDHQAGIMGTDGKTPPDMPRGNLEGWDFEDLATHEDPLYPRVC
ncbi:purine and uridine phosphorylase [Aspergillus affinis]|uniref:purine and uridine phosphorylase n=1 Tax=Aspergillus affinis TaxID=1070780 RepID=UPI0022FDB260|nr:purine and uridine phosphorylase [Aspergillus affinis]KAI9043628.1 purine and uridine phosphorylase [Aspergillus affinis]